MIKHTPGPWTVEWPMDGGALIMAEDGHGHLGRVDVRYSKRNNLEEAEANARLIAAAPDLLEACRDTVNKLVNIHTVGSDQDKGRWLSSISLLASAIAKATGKKC